MNPKAVLLGLGNLRCKVAEKIYLHTNIDITKPVQIYGLVTHRCNARCRMCDYWKTKTNQELPAETWINGLRSFKSFTPNFNINFSGGEPLLKEDFFDILEYCSRENIIAGFTTNGILLNSEKIKKILDLNLFNLNISIDSLEPRVHDGIRGFTGLLENNLKMIDALLVAKKKTGNYMKVIIKTTVSNENVKNLDRIAEYVKSRGDLRIHFQPIEEHWNAGAKKMFEIEERDLEAAIEKLIEMKRNHYPILNSERSFENWRLHFKRERNRRPATCDAALRTLLIRGNGDMTLCIQHEATIGNLADADIRRDWYSPLAREYRKKLVRCRKLCTTTCYSKKDMKYYFELFVNYFR